MYFRDRLHLGGNPMTELTQPTETLEPSQYHIRTTGYYHIIKDHEREHERDSGFTAGRLVYVYAAQDALHVFINTHTWKYDLNDPKDIDSFDTHFEFAPNGAQLRQQEVVAIMQEIDDIDLSLGQTQVALTGFTPHATAGQLDGSSSLVPTGTPATAAKIAVAAVRNSVTKTKKTLEAKTRQLKLLLSEQSRALEIKSKELEALMTQATEAIWTINLYLGKDEEIHILKKGPPASPETKITIRQNVMYMDEECALAARAGGIDIHTIDDFDKWLLANPDHLKQVAPEDKSIVALHIKREKKDYGDPVTNAELNKANQYWTYFLIRNGDNLYRVHIDLYIGKHLLPPAENFDDYFWETKTDYDQPGYPSVRVPLKPGSKAYMAAMEQAEDSRKHYLRIVLVLQGLLDRTPIFKPMPVERINLCDPKDCDEWLQLIYEQDNVITDGRPLFDDWQDTINNQLDVGHRIIGIFDYNSNIRGSDYRNSRIYPRTADMPSSMILHTIEERECEGTEERYVFRYKRTGEVTYGPRKSDRYWGEAHEPETRARCYVRKNDGFILNFDAATLEEMEYYSTNRLSRKSYKDMIPLLKAAAILKRQEQADEAPFRLLLVGQISIQHKISVAEAEATVDELIKWWKFKNRTHRALLSDDNKALAMIVTEFGLRRKQAAVRQRAAALSNTIIQVIGAQTPAPVLIAHKSDNKYVAYVPSTDQNVWVTEQLWSHNRQTNDIKLRDTKPWKLVDKRHERWEVLYQHERWAQWRINPLLNQVLTDLELDTLIGAAWEGAEAKIVKQSNKVKPTGDDEEDDDDSGTPRVLKLCAYHNDDFQITIWYSDVGPILPSTKLINTGCHEPQVTRCNLRWERTKDGVKLSSRLDHNHYSYNPDPGKRPWEKDYQGHKLNFRMLELYHDNINLLSAEFDKYHEHKKLVQQLKKQYAEVPNLVSEIMYAAKLAIARAEFDAEYGDPELWEDHLEELKILKVAPAHLMDAIHLCTERNIDVGGLTLKQVYNYGQEFGLFNQSHSFLNSNKRTMPTDVPLEYVIPKRETTPAVDESDDD